MIVGTAGHVDHGKTALVHALTGVDTDRLVEEKARGISIDLGFAYLHADDGATLGFVDVPGHERFLRNMLAGATGIDFVLLVVAADDGVMPQTREHLAIADLLGVARGLVALTKSDLVSPARSDVVREEVRQAVRGTALREAPIVAVSSLTGEGVVDVREALFEAARALGRREAGGRFRLAVDRCFSLPGAGTIVTGPVISGAVAVGDAVVVSPVGLRARVRSIHAQNAAAERGVAGERCALNLVGDGVTREAIGRGAVVLDPALHAPTARIDAELTLLTSETKPLEHWVPVRVYHAAAEIAARVALLEPVQLEPGRRGLAQLVLERPLAAAVGDRFVLRDASASRTLGGGRFLDLRAPHRRRRAPERLAQLDAIASPDARAALAAALARGPFFVDAAAFARDRALADEETRTLLAAVAHVRIAVAERSVLFSSETWSRLAAGARAALDAVHRAHPELPGLTAAQLATAVEPRLPARIFAGVARSLVESGALKSERGALRSPEHRFGLDERDRRLWLRIVRFLSDDARFRPPLAIEIAALSSEPVRDVRRVLKTLARERVVIEVALDRFFRRETVEEIAGIVADLARSGDDGLFSAAQLRDRLDNGRKVAIQILEYFDGQGLTLRRGDLRVLGPGRLEFPWRAVESAAIDRD